MLDVICEDCRAHFEKLQQYLTGMGIPYEIDTDIVRGLDYYTKTVFEIQSDTIGAKTAICGGGRYDGLVAQLGGDPTCGVGFGLGLDRLILFMENNGIPFGDKPNTELFIASMGEDAERYAQTLVYRLRRAGICAEKDCCGRSLKAQMKYADKIGAKYTVVLGGNELETGRVALKEMKTGESQEIHLDELENKLKEE